MEPVPPSGLPGDRAGGDLGRLIERGVSASGDRPLLTWYHRALGQRVELSLRTFGNWVAKTANLLVEELGLGAGDRVATLLPSHWQGPVVLAGCWRAGVSVVPAGGCPAGSRPAVGGKAVAAALAEAGCAACFVHEELLPEVLPRFRGAALPLLAITADPLGRGAVDLGAALPFTRLAASMPDHFDGDGAAPGVEALLVPEPGGGRSFTQGELVAAAADLGARLGLGGGDRIYSGLDLDAAAGAVAGVVLPLATGTGVVLEREPDLAALPERLAGERVTVALLTAEQARTVQAGAGLDPGIRLAVEPFIDGSFRPS
jgi:uncharacterized protein (TIGR03089 family)